MLAGDLNALTRGDYSVEAWSALEQRAEDRGWAFGASDAEGGCLAFLKDKGFVDLWQAAGARAFDDDDDDEASDGGGGGGSGGITAHGLYRIDYVMGSPELQAHGVASSRAFVANARDWDLVDASDHSPVVVDLLVPAKAEVGAGGPGGGAGAGGGPAKM